MRTLFGIHGLDSRVGVRAVSWRDVGVVAPRALVNLSFYYLRSFGSPKFLETGQLAITGGSTLFHKSPQAGNNADF